MSQLNTGGEEKKKSLQSFSDFTCNSGIPSLLSQPRTVTTATESHVARSITGPIPFDVTPSLKLCNSGRLQTKPSSRFEIIGKQNVKITSSSSNTGAWEWQVTDDNVPVLPEHHPLERTAVFAPHTPAPIVAERVAECLKLRSISAEFVVGKSVKAKCLSADCPPVEFRVFLYRGKKNYSHGIIVEVQRRSGFSINFMADCVAILDAAENKQPSTASLSSPSLPPLSTDSEYSDDCIAKSPTFEVAQELLHSSETSRRMLGIQFLLSQTNPKKVGASKSSVVTQRLLSPEFARTQNVLFEISGSPDATLRSYGISIWANMFSSLTRKDLPLVSAHNTFITKNLIPTLFEDVKNAGSNTRNASLALHCMYMMLKNFCDCLLDAILEIDNAMDIFENAKVIGRSKNISLSRHAELMSGLLDRAS